MNSGTRQVVKATDDAARMWTGVQDVWDEAVHIDREMVLDIRESFQSLVGSAVGAGTATRSFKDSMAGFRDFAQQEVDEALDAHDAAIQACESVAELGRTVVEVLTRSLEA
ncbi:MAG: hypothetical protein H0V97_00195 [Actinobacteria bacterium]|nr:hypothetical protein [Actinomycetota bacterium]